MPNTCGSPKCIFYNSSPMEVKGSFWKPKDVIVYTNHYCFREAEPVLRTSTLDSSEYPVACTDHTPYTPNSCFGFAKEND